MARNLGNFDGQVVLVVGAASGIGRAVARLISSRGGTVVISDLDKTGLASLKEELSLNDNQVKDVNLGDISSVSNLIVSLITDHSQIDALINTAGIVGPTNTKLEDVDWSAFEKLCQSIYLEPFG